MERERLGAQSARRVGGGGIGTFDMIGAGRAGQHGVDHRWVGRFAGSLPFVPLLHRSNGRGLKTVNSTSAGVRGAAETTAPPTLAAHGRTGAADGAVRGGRGESSAAWRPEKRVAHALGRGSRLCWRQFGLSRQHAGLRGTAPCQRWRTKQATRAGATGLAVRQTRFAGRGGSTFGRQWLLCRVVIVTYRIRRNISHARCARHLVAGRLCSPVRSDRHDHLCGSKGPQRQQQHQQPKAQAHRPCQWRRGRSPPGRSDSTEHAVHGGLGWFAAKHHQNASRHVE